MCGVLLEIVDIGKLTFCKEYQTRRMCRAVTEHMVAEEVYGFTPNDGH